MTPEDGDLPIWDTITRYTGEDLTAEYILTQSSVEIDLIVGQTIITKMDHCLDSGDLVWLFFEDQLSQKIKSLVDSVVSAKSFTVAGSLPSCYTAAYVDRPVVLSTLTGIIYNASPVKFAMAGDLVAVSGESTATITKEYSECNSTPGFEPRAGDRLISPGASGGLIVEGAERSIVRRSEVWRLVLGGNFTANYSGTNFSFEREGEAIPGSVFSAPSLAFSGNLNYGELNLNIDKANFPVGTENKILRVFSGDELILNLLVRNEE